MFNSNKIKLVPDASSVSLECAICYENFNENRLPLQLPCDCCELTCSECLAKPEYNFKCPVCMQQFTKEDARHFHKSFLNVLKTTRPFCVECSRFLRGDETEENHVCTQGVVESNQMQSAASTNNQHNLQHQPEQNSEQLEDKKDVNKQKQKKNKTRNQSNLKNNDDDRNSIAFFENADPVVQRNKVKLLATNITDTNALFGTSDLIFATGTRRSSNNDSTTDFDDIGGDDDEETNNDNDSPSASRVENFMENTKQFASFLSSKGKHALSKFLNATTQRERQ